MAGEQLRRRLTQVAPFLPSGESAPTLAAHIRAFGGTGAEDQLWLLLTAVLGAFPTVEEVLATRRRIELESAEAVAEWLTAWARESDGCEHELVVLAEHVVAECDYSARKNHHSGIQRVVRSTMSRWYATRPVVPVAWAGSALAFRELGEDELTRVMRWTGSGEAPREQEPSSAPATIVVPWRSTVVLLDMPQRAAHPRLAALAQYSGNTVTAVGYDCIPVVSGDLVPPVLPEEFVHYLSVIKHSTRVAGISASATVEYEGFAQMVRSQGLPGPDVVECALPVDGLGRPAGVAVQGERPVVLCIGSFEPRKNQLAVLAACERLWVQGLDFELRLIGPGGWRRDVRDQIKRLRRAARDVVMLTAISEAELADNYRDARCTVFVSLHEGYGLPVAESIAHGVPAITSDYGSTAEIAGGGGCVLVDPRNDLAIADALRLVLTDDAFATELRAQINGRQDRSWDDYAAELWECLVVLEGRR